MAKNAEQGGGQTPERKIIVDQEQVELVLGRLVCAFENKDFPYNLESARVPQDHRHMPETLTYGGKEHAMFLWTVCYYMRGGIKSNVAVQRLSAMYDENPDLFVAELAKDVDEAIVAQKLTEHGLGFQETIARAWVENARRLHELYDGDPRNIFNDINTYQQSLKAIKNDGKGNGFIGFQEKMVSMIIYYLADEQLIEQFDFPLPVDVHVLRVSIANELLKFEGYNEDDNLLDDALLDTARNMYLDYATKHGLDMLRLADAVWLLSQTLCGQQPGNITLEPNGVENRNGRSTLLEPFPVDPSSEAQRAMYEKTCGQCPIQDTCKWNVPSKTYYVQGQLKKRGERVKFPTPAQERLF